MRELHLFAKDWAMWR